MPPVPFHATPGFASWLAEHQVSLVITGYESARLFLVGTEEGRLVVEERPFVPCMGLALEGDDLFVGTRAAVWRFRREEPGVFRASRCWVTDDVKVHDVGVEADGTPIFVNTLCDCLVRPRPRGVGYEVLWKPPFIPETTPGDRCHLNGLAMDGRTPRYLTCVARSSEPGGWRASMVGGGCVLDLETDQPVLEGLTMPHSPRLHRGDLWLHQSGTGWFGRADLASGSFEPRVFAPGFLRGLCFHGDCALAGLSQVRYFGRTTFPIEQELARRGEAGSCGVCVMDPEAGEVVHRLVFEGIPEVYDLQVIPGAARLRLEMQGGA